MNTQENTSEHLTKNQRRNLIVMLGIALVLAILASTPSVRLYFQSKFTAPDRIILSKVSGYIQAAQKQYLVFKVKEGHGLSIEVYEVSEKGDSQTLKQKFNLEDDSDSYVMIDKNTTNLALSDVDQDGSLEIIAPSVDRNGNSRLNTFKFDPNLNSFSPMVKSQ